MVQEKERRDKSHEDQIERWARFCLENPGKWKEIHTEFINAQFEMAENFYRRLAEDEEGKKILRRLKVERMGFHA